MSSGSDRPRGADEVGTGVGVAREDTRARLLGAAARAYAQHGYLGATTRQIARMAEVNEVTIFRHFRSKDALLDEALREHAAGVLPAPLPEEPVDPPRELSAWCARELERLRGSRELLRHCFADGDERPEHLRVASVAMAEAGRTVRDYVARLEARRLISAPENAEAATAMLVSALVADGLTRGQIAEVYPHAVEGAPAAYAAAFLAALGAPQAPADSSE